MNILLNRFPDTVTIQGVDTAINTDFRIGIQFEMMMMDHEQSEMDKIIKGIQLYYSTSPSNIHEAIDKILWFYNCGITLTDAPSGKSSNSQEQIFSYEQDQYMIYTAFLLYYHIDLNEVDYLHWWKFKQLFHELPDDAKIKKVMMYRNIHINSNMTKEQKQFYADMKSIYKLKDKRTEKQKAKNFASILAGGMFLPEDKRKELERIHKEC